MRQGEGSRASVPQNPARARTVGRHAGSSVLDEARAEGRRSAYQCVRLTQVVRRQELMIFRRGAENEVASRFVTPPCSMSLLREHHWVFGRDELWLFFSRHAFAAESTSMRHSVDASNRLIGIAT